MMPTDLAAALGPAIAQRIGVPRYQLWFAGNTRLTWQEDDNELTVGVPNRFYQEWLQNTFTIALVEAGTEVLGRAVAVQFVIDPELFQAHRQQTAAPAPASEPIAALPTPTVALSEPTGKPLLKLADFIVGPGNRLAHAAAAALTESPERMPTPLVLYGPVGVGKTHLLEGVYAGLRQRPQIRSPQFITAEEFTNLFLQALKANKLGPFRRQFRDAGALLVDGIQFLSGKTATQMEFLHTIEALKRHGRPIACACDSHPKMIADLAPELTDRLVAGVVWSIDPPDFETRVGIAQAKSAHAGSAMPEDVCRHLAAQLRGNVRELEGAMHSVIHYSQTHHRPISLATARAATGDLVRHSTRSIQIREVEQALCRVLGIEGRSLHYASRARAVSHPRMLAMYLARKHTGAGYGDIGKFFGGRNHSTAIAAEKKVRQWIERDEALFIAEQKWQARSLIEQVERGLL